MPGLRRPPPADPETERYRLFTAVDAILADAARRWPTVVVIDDLHWAGAQTLALLRHLARSGTASRLLVIGTFRDTGDEITDPLAGCLADLRRTETTSRLRLAGLDRATVERFVAGAVGHDLDADLTAPGRGAGRAQRRQRLLRRRVVAPPRRQRRRGPGRATAGWSARRRPSVGVPDSVREVVADRLASSRRRPAASSSSPPSPVSGSSCGCWPGRSTCPTTRSAPASTSWSRPSCSPRSAGSCPTYQFAHAIVRDTVERTIAPSARARLHQRVAEAIEAVYEADRRPVLAELARHFAGAAAARRLGQGRLLRPAGRPVRRCARWPTTRRSAT